MASERTSDVPKHEFALAGEVRLRRYWNVPLDRGLGPFESWEISVHRGVFTGIVRQHVEAIFLAAGQEPPPPLTGPVVPEPAFDIVARLREIQEADNKLSTLLANLSNDLIKVR